MARMVGEWRDGGLEWWESGGMEEKKNRELVGNRRVLKR